MLLAVVVTAGGRAHAYEAMVQATVLNQDYQLRTAGGDTLTRSRLDTYLRLFVLDLLPAKPDEDRSKPRTQMHFVAGMRLRADFGGYTRQWNEASDVHGHEEHLMPPAFELLYSHLAVTDLAGFIDLKLGRQFQLDPMDFYGYDGIQARFRLPFHLALEVVSGLRQSGRYALDAPIFLLEGTDITDSKPGWMPMVAVAAQTHDLSFLSARLAYRATWHIIDPEAPGDIYPEGGDVPATQMAEEKLILFASATFFKGKLQPYGGIRYNLLTARLDEAQAGVATRFGESRIRAEYVHDSPDFDGDSIFNIFNIQPYQEARIWYEHRFTPRWQAYLRGTVRFFEGGASEAPLETERALAEPDVGGGLGATYLGSRASARLDLYWQEGYGGRTLGAFGYYRHEVIRSWLAIEGRGVVAYWDDELAATPEGVTAGLTVGARVSFGRMVALHVLLEDNFGTFSKSDLRLYALLNVAWCTAGSCPAGEVVP